MVRARNRDQGEVPWRPSAPSRRPAQRIHRRNRHPQRPGQERPHRPRGPRHRQDAPATGSCRPRRDRRRLVQDLQRGPRLSGSQARRSELQRSDLRQPLRRRGRRGLQPHLVPPEPPQRRLSHRLACEQALRYRTAPARRLSGEPKFRLFMKGLEPQEELRGCFLSTAYGVAPIRQDRQVRTEP